ncbi:MAG: hypothetical protein KDA87_18340 [Planctomycetales bacterium]|nr:hypothetical protein [Planctomycetales bacterium]
MATIPGDEQAWADEPVRLIGTIVKWRYPDAEIGKSEMADAATVDSSGKRTVPSSILKTTMTTPDPVDNVLAFYRNLLTCDPADDDKLGLAAGTGRSVVFSDESENRPFQFHTILVHSRNRSTTIVITRGPNEAQTVITWKQYLRHEVPRATEE